MDSGRRLDVAARAASYNVLLQVLLRASSFILNGFVLRYVQAELLGVVNLRLTLLYNTILFLSREALRKACLSQTLEEKQWSHVFNLLWCSLPLAVVCSVLLGGLWLSPWLEQPTVARDAAGVVAFSLAAGLELLAEPLWLLAQAHQRVSLKVVAEGVPQLLRCVLVACGVVLVPQWGLLVFVAAQLAYSLGYLAIYYAYFSFVLHTPTRPPSSLLPPLPVKRITDILPHSDKAGVWLSPYLISLSWSFFKQSFLKQILTDGERFVMTLFGVLSFAEQGIYDVIHNLGSLVARFIFLPIEESFYVFFASTLYRGEPASQQDPATVSLVAETLKMLLRFVLLAALTILSFGYGYSHLALDLYGGRLLSSGAGPSLLRWYCLYVLLLAVNGVTECFFFAAMSQREVDRYNRMMVVFSLVFLSSSLVLTRLTGSVGFILANCVNMAVRILHSCHFIHTFFSATPHRPLPSSLPSLPTLASFLLSFLITTASEAMFCCDLGWPLRLLHICVGVVCVCAVLLVVTVWEGELCSFLGDRLPARLGAGIRMATASVRRTLTLRSKAD